MSGTFETSDLYLAAYLVACDFDLASTRREDRMTFVFDADEDLQPTLDRWQTTAGVVVAHRYAQAVRDLKARVFR